MTSDERWSQISRLYHDAVSVAPADRAEFLQKACGLDDSLRAEIESLLIDDSRADRLLEPHGHSTPKDSRRDLTGQRIGVYEVRSLLGAGGMGEVYRAHDPKLGREVAIKVLPPIFTANPERLARFSREARLLAALNHPNIGAIYGWKNPTACMRSYWSLSTGRPSPIGWRRGQFQSSKRSGSRDKSPMGSTPLTRRGSSIVI